MNPVSEDCLYGDSKHLGRAAGAIANPDLSRSEASKGQALRLSLHVGLLLRNLHLKLRELSGRSCHDRTIAT